MTVYEMSGEPYSKKSGLIKHSNERNFQIMTFKLNKYSLSFITCNGQYCSVLNRLFERITVTNPRRVQGVRLNLFHF